MPVRHLELINNEIYHIVIRGVAGSLIFKDINDYYRGIFSLYEFNTSKPVVIRERRKARVQEKANKGPVPDQRDKLVEILAFCFMPNHIHLLAKQLKDGGISKFMGKFGAGYASYFNKKYDRKGYLFQGRFLSVHIKNDEQLKTVFVYIHSNPVSLIEEGWKEKGIINPEKVIVFLESYKWSSYLDYIGRKNFPSVIERNFMWRVFGGEKECRDFIENWIKYKGTIREFTDLALE